MSAILSYGASVAGTSHIKTNLPCHDSHRLCDIQEGLGIIACISDGMGSAKKAEVGSALASETLIDTLTDTLDFTSDDETIIKTIMEAYQSVHERLALEAATTKEDISALNATLMMFMHLEDGRQFTAQVGDCVAIGKATDDEKYEIIIEPQKGEYANQTYSICSRKSIESVEIKKLKTPYTAIAMMSDGIESFTVNAKTKEVSKGFFDPFFNVFGKPAFDESKVRDSLIRFLRSDRINKRTDDDKTLLLIHIPLND